MSTFTFTHETKRHWGKPDEDCTLLCEAEVTRYKPEAGFGSHSTFAIEGVEILSVDGASPIIGPELRAELHRAAEAAREAMA